MPKLTSLLATKSRMIIISPLGMPRLVYVHPAICSLFMSVFRFPVSAELQNAEDSSIDSSNGHVHFFFNDYLLSLSPFSSCTNRQCIPMYRANSSLIMLVITFSVMGY